MLNQYYFRIPDYQRGYSWEDSPQRTDLWDDIDNMVPQDTHFRPHYTGCLYVDKMPNDKKLPEESYIKSDFYYLVDGQQRMTTFAILLFELLKYAKEHEEKYNGQIASFWINTFICTTKYDGTCPVYKFSYEDPEYKSFLESVIFEDKSIIHNEYAQINSCYKQNLIKAKSFFYERIKGMDTVGRAALFDKLLYYMPFDFNPIEKEFDVQAVFETMNNRGKPLTNLEKLKNRLMFLSDYVNSKAWGQHDDEQDLSSLAQTAQRASLRKTINTAWANIYKNLGRKDAPLSEDEFLSAHLSLLKDPKYRGAFPEDEAGDKVFKMFCQHPERYGEPAITPEIISEYANKLARFSKNWREIYDSDETLVKKILILSYTKEVKILLAVAFKLRDDGIDIDSLLIAIEKVLFRNLLPGTSVMDIRSFVTAAKDLYNGKQGVSIGTVTDDLENAAKGYDLEAIRNRFVDMFNYVRGNIGFHRWNGLKYLLFEYEDKLRLEANKAKGDELPPRILLEEFYDTQIEHVLPQHWEDHWKDTIDNYDKSLRNRDFLNGIDFDVIKAHRLLINSLGNLTILRGGKNAHVSNDSWVDKQKAYKGASFNEMDIAEIRDESWETINRNQWTEEDILNRGKLLFEFLLTKIEYSGVYYNAEETILPLHILKVS